MIELATKMITAERRIGSQRAASNVIGKASWAKLSGVSGRLFLNRKRVKSAAC
jgi:hypothetical protein